MSVVRHVGAVLALSAIAGGGALATPSATGAAVAQPPNLVVVLIDDLDELITPYWDAMPESAARLRDTGAVFDRAFAPTPSCCPARAMLLTGEYAHNNGVYNNIGINGGFSAFQAGGNESHTLAVQLDAAGYRTGLFGKYLNGYSSQPTYIPPGWDDWFVFADDAFYDGYGYDVNDNGAIVHYGLDPADYSTDVVAAQTLQFLDESEQSDAEPFFALVSATAPHIPIAPAVRHTDHAWATAELPARPNLYEPDISDKPWWLQMAAPNRDVWASYMVQDYRNRMGSLIAVDEMIAAILDRLDQLGELDNTYVVFTSDNGYNYGAHHLNDKLAPYEESVRIPMVIAGPGIAPGTHSELVGLQDLFPTMVELAGLAPVADVDGRSLVGVWSGAAATWRQSMLLEYRPTVAADTLAANVWFFAMMFDMPSYEAIRTDRWVFIRWWTHGEMGPTFREYELYDLDADPYQLDNLLAAPNGIVDNLPVLAVLVQQLDTLVACSGASCP